LFKLIGIAAGYYFFVWWGVLFGLILGSIIDRIRAYGQGAMNPLRNAIRQAVFLETVFISMGKLAKADGRVSEEEIALRAHSGWKDIQSARTTIFVPHAPPANTMVDLLTNGNHVGSTAIRKFIEQHHPTVVVCGHIHEARGIDTLGASKIINCGPAGKGYYAVITLGKEVLLEMKG